MADWVITIPKTIPWEHYEKELKAVHDWKQVMNFRIPYNPKNVNPNDRCFVVWNGYVRGWMAIVWSGHAESFTCSTTGEVHKGGYYVSRSGPFHYIDPIPMRGFQGFRKYNQFLGCDIA